MPVAKTAEVSQTAKDVKPEDLKGIHSKILYIQRNIEVEKVGEHPKRESKHLRFEDVLERVVDGYLNDLGIITSIRNLTGSHSPAFDQGGRYKPSAFIQGTFVFRDVESGEEWPIDVSGEGASTGGASDAIRIAHTTFAKIAYLEAFKIREKNASRYDGDDASTAIPDAELPAPEKSEAQKADAETLASLVKQVNALKEGGIDGKIVAAEGSLISDRILGEGKKMAEWKKDSRVMEALVAKLEAIASTGEVS